MILAPAWHITDPGPIEASFNLPHDWKWSLANQPVAFPRTERAGVLTHPAWTCTHGAETSKTTPFKAEQSGSRTHLLGGTVPDVPIGVDAPRSGERTHLLFRNRLEGSHCRMMDCQRCHIKMDPLGLPFEALRSLASRIQRLDAGQPSRALPGAIAADPLSPVHAEFPSPVAMIERLAASKEVEQVFVMNTLSDVSWDATKPSAVTAKTLRDAHKAYRDGKGSLQGPC